MSVGVADHKKSASWWVVTIAFWAAVALMAYAAIWSFVSGNWVDGAAFSFFALCMVITVHTPKWLRRFIGSFRKR